MTNAPQRTGNPAARIAMEIPSGVSAKMTVSIAGFKL
jgi:hypothetical protein